MTTVDQVTDVLAVAGPGARVDVAGTSWTRAPGADPFSDEWIAKPIVVDPFQVEVPNAPRGYDESQDETGPNQPPRPCRHEHWDVPGDSCSYDCTWCGSCRAWRRDNGSIDPDGYHTLNCGHRTGYRS